MFQQETWIRFDCLRMSCSVSRNYIEIVFKKWTVFDKKQKFHSLPLEFFQTVILVLIEFKNDILIVFVLIEIYRHDRKTILFDCSTLYFQRLSIRFNLF